MYLYFGVPTSSSSSSSVSPGGRPSSFETKTDISHDNPVDSSRRESTSHHVRRRSSGSRKYSKSRVNVTWHPANPAVYNRIHTKVLAAKIISYPKLPEVAAQEEHGTNAFVTDGRREQQYTVLQTNFGSTESLRQQAANTSGGGSVVEEAKNRKEPVRIMLLIPVPGRNPSIRCWYSTGNSPPVDLIENCFPGTQDTDDKELVMGGASDTVVPSDQLKEYSAVVLEANKSRKTEVNVLETIEQLKQKLGPDTVSESFATELQEHYPSDNFCFLSVELELTNELENLSCCLEYTHIPLQTDQLFVPSRRLVEAEQMSVFGDVPINVRWNTSVYSVGTIRREDWSGGGKDPDTMFQDLKKRFASGSYRKIVPPRLQWADTSKSIAAHIENWLDTCPVLLYPQQTIRMRKIMAGPNKDMFLQLETESGEGK